MKKLKIALIALISIAAISAIAAFIFFAIEEKEMAESESSSSAIIMTAGESDVEISLESRDSGTATYGEPITYEGQTYKTVKIGEQTWMAENLNYETDKSWCYDNNKSNCEKYGRLYSWNAAMNACPSGWHLPSSEDWNILAVAVGGVNIAGKMLKSISDWGKDAAGNSRNGTDIFGFSALPGGDRNFYNGAFYLGGFVGNWWSATEHSSGDGRAYHRNLADTDYLYEMSGYKAAGYSVRCVEGYL